MPASCFEIGPEAAGEPWCKAEVFGAQKDTQSKENDLQCRPSDIRVQTLDLYLLSIYTVYV